MPACYNRAEVITMTLKQLRIEKELTQKACAEYLGIPLRTYCRYESDEPKINNIKRQYVFDRLNAYGAISENQGILTIDKIKTICTGILNLYRVDCCYLFGSYAKGNATETSDVDLLISTANADLPTAELAQVLRETLKKKVDLLDTTQLCSAPALLNDILKYGIKIYG